MAANLELSLPHLSTHRKACPKQHRKPGAAVTTHMLPTRGGKIKQQSQELKDLFLNEKPARIMVFLRDRTSYTGEISQQVDATYAHTAKIMYRMKDHGLVKSKRAGRKTKYTLTSEGRKLADNFLSLFYTFEGRNPTPGSIST